MYLLSLTKNYLMSLNNHIMKLNKYLAGTTLLLMICLSACKKTTYDKTVNGEALGDFRLSAPSNNLNVVLNSATPSSSITISWTASKPGISISPNYKWVAALKTAGNLETPLLDIPSGNNGSATSLTLTQKQLDDALAAKGIAAGAKTELIWSVKAGNGTSTLLSQDVYNITITRMKDGSTPFTVLGPASSLTVQSINPGSTTTNFTFKWTKSAPAAGSPAVKYKVLFAERKLDVSGNEIPVNWSAPLFSIVSDNAGLDTLATVTHKQLSDSLTNKGFTNPGNPVTLKWTVVAVSGTWSQLSDFSNSIAIVREVKLFLVGGSSPIGWNPPQSIRLIEDSRFPGTFFIYTKLIASGGGIKFLSENTDWNTPTQKVYGNSGGDGNGGNLLQSSNSGNITIAADGVYRITVDLTANKYYLQTAVANGIGGMGMIGQFQGWSQPAVKMNYVSTDLFIYIATMGTNDEFKFHDGNDWTNSSNNLNRWYATDNTNKMVIDPGSGFNNFKWTGATGRVRAIWDGTDPLNLKYDLSSAAEMRVVGDGINQVGVNDWDPPTSPQMTYSGSGVWTITLTLKASKDIKFLAGNAWGALDYEDNSGQNPATGVTKPIKWTGGDNFKTPAIAGSYTITLNENTQTVTIN
jgi:hypothetical protein